MPSCRNLHLLPYRVSPTDAVAAHIIEHTSQLPDLTDVTIVISEPRSVSHLRQAVLNHAAAHGAQALLGPHIVSFEQWLTQYLPSDTRICTAQQRLLILVEALFEQPALLGQANAWTLADALLELFDELTLNQITLDDDIDEFARQLASWYAVKQIDLRGLQHEARLLHGLWRAWHTQLHAQQLIDSANARILALQRSLTECRDTTVTHFIGIEPQQRVEFEWVEEMLALPQVHLWWHGEVHSGTPAHRCDLDLIRLYTSLAQALPEPTQTQTYQASLLEVFNQTPALHVRAGKLREQFPQSAIQKHVGKFSAQNAEQEARAIDVQCREWLLAGKQQIAIVTENRRLARRVRALLERAGVQLQDAAGWALSTTRAAATLEALLICIEDDFAKDALLDLFKSPYLFPELDREVLKNQVYRLEHDIIQHEGINNGLARYQSAILDRAERLREIWNVPPSSVSDLLQRLADACRPLVACKQISRAQSLTDYLDALLQTLHSTGLYESFSHDDAGVLLLAQLDEMLQAARIQGQQRPWRDFRAWLSRNLEKQYFRPSDQDSAVELLSLAQSQLRHFDAIIIAGAEQEYLPGMPSRSPFFNDAVRAQLGLSTREQFNQSRLRQFFRLLQSAPSILISHRAAQDGEPITASPWLDALISFHRTAYANDLQTTRLHELLRSEQSQVWRCDTTALPDRQQQPRPNLIPELIPETVSASDYQSLLDCPYQFFAARCLKLSAPEEVREVLSKREYGERVHLCLQAFHSDMPRYPGPFSDALNASSRARAIDLLQDISEAVFKQDLLDNYTHRGWYHQWREIIPVYIDWQIERALSLQVESVEYKSETRIDDLVSIKGRLDRIDRSASGYAILDYKSGQIPTQTNIKNGEKIQLPFYAMLLEAEGKPVERVEYLQIGRARDFKSRFAQTGDELQQLTQSVSTRLQHLIYALHEGAHLPAWEDENSCRFCDMQNLCRMGGWQENEGEAT